MHVGTEEIQGATVEVHVNSRHGSWEVRTPAGDRLGHADTKDKAMAQARAKLTKHKTRVAVAFLTTQGEAGVATGLHASNGAVLARIDGVSMQLSSYNDRHALRADTPPEKVAQMLELRASAQAAERTASAIEREYQVDVLRLVTAAIAEKQEKLAAKEEATDAN